MAEFKGFGKETLPFFKALAFHQSKEWFEENRSLYEGQVKQPLGDLVEELTARFAKARIPLAGDRKRSLFRINRDIRFSKDKSPYKTNGGAMLTRSGSKGDPGLLYIHLDPEGCFTASGFYMPDSTLLDAFRKKIVRDPAAYNRMIGALKKAGLVLSEMSPLTRMPRGYEDLKDSPIASTIRHPVRRLRAVRRRDRQPVRRSCGAPRRNADRRPRGRLDRPSGFLRPSLSGAPRSRNCPPAKLDPACRPGRRPG